MIDGFVAALEPGRTPREVGRLCDAVVEKRAYSVDQSGGLYARPPVGLDPDFVDCAEEIIGTPQTGWVWSLPPSRHPRQGRGLVMGG